MRLRQPRYEPLADGELPDRSREALATLGARGGLSIYRTAARTPYALAALLGVGRYISSDLSDLAAREREIVILRTAGRCRSGYIWAQHVVAGRRSGLGEAEIAALKINAEVAVDTTPTPFSWNSADRALIAATDELVADHFIGETTWASLVRWFGDKARMDVIYTAGHYVQVAMIANTFGVQLDAGQTLDHDIGPLPPNSRG